MSASFAKLKIKGYPKFVDGTVSGSSVASYELQLNPTELDISFDLNSIIDNDEEPASAAGVPVGDKNKVYNKQSISFNFFIDTLITIWGTNRRCAACAIECLGCLRDA